MDTVDATLAQSCNSQQSPTPLPYSHLSKCETAELLHIFAPLNGPQYRHSKHEVMVEYVTPSTLKDMVRTIAESASPGP
jgi:hypothetical protein